MTGLYSFSETTSGTCKASRGFTDCVVLNSCDGDINSHFHNRHLSKENVFEKGLILARTGEEYEDLSRSSFYPGKVLASPWDLPVFKAS